MAKIRFPVCTGIFSDSVKGVEAYVVASTGCFIRSQLHPGLSCFKFDGKEIEETNSQVSFLSRFKSLSKICQTRKVQIFWTNCRWQKPPLHFRYQVFSFFGLRWWTEHHFWGRYRWQAGVGSGAARHGSRSNQNATRCNATGGKKASDPMSATIRGRKT